ncbi:hypothetical protein ACFFH2_07000 [Enterococcus devriesei]|uniref:hypothetical protein n=1 Tax=Enterococcus devriesei TaxID=319970 RepID=UPI001B800F8A|nr:hypothetical protein [Enterococcus devriesei]MBU5366710.1 hypothetical protein [Enterococcus devriesei]MDT2820966.1 hypothetical protein [Enterococcus devriesei]MDU6525028.1 hypothetical protein [Enterococcus sp.]
MVTKQVSGTIMLHLEDGSKRFLVHETESSKEFARTDTQTETTVLASFLNFLKSNLHIDVNRIRLVELTNTQSNGANMPLYVFEMTSEEATELPKDFAWETPDSVREILGTIEIEGVPLFE